MYNLTNICICTSLALFGLLICTIPTLQQDTTFSEKTIAFQKHFFGSPEVWDAEILEPTVFIALFVRNKEHSLPYFFGAVENLNYPKSRIFLWIVTDHNSDNSLQVILKWADVMRKEYQDIVVENPDSEWYYENQKGDLHWTEDRHIWMLQLRQRALDKARSLWADFIFYVDADNMLINPHILWHLIAADRLLVSPMLHTLGSYSNFWCGQNEKGYYLRTDDYFPIKNREKLGTFEVPMVHSIFLINLSLKLSQKVQFWPLKEDYSLDLDDIIVFSYNCKVDGIQMHIDNRYVYGYMAIPLRPDQTLKEEVETFVHLLMEVITEPPVGVGIEVIQSDIIKSVSNTSKLGFDEIYMINLDRRKDRFYRMNTVLQYQGIDFTHFHAIDSKTLNTTYLKAMNIDMLPGFTDPYRERTLTRGEIGCFLSHYFIWKEVIEKGYQQVMVLEDDIRFENGFVRRLAAVMDGVKSVALQWDLIYIGRKRMQTKVPEKRVAGTDFLVEADYSYWTLGYLLTNSGARKLLAGNPLPKMVPVDEYLPIMFNKHPIQSYKDHFRERNVAAFSAEPLLVYPTHYTGQDNYYSDTETSSIWEDVGKGAKDEL